MAHTDKDIKRVLDKNAAWERMAVRKRSIKRNPKRTATRSAQVRFALANLDN